MEKIRTLSISSIYFGVASQLLICRKLRIV